MITSVFSVTDDTSLSSESPPAHVCSRCCEEFSSRSELEQHQRDCPAHPLVLIVNEDEDLLSGSDTFPASLTDFSAGGSSETVDTFEMKNTSQDRSLIRAELLDCFCSRRSSRSGGNPESHSSISGSLFPESLALPGCSVDREGPEQSDSSHSETAFSHVLQQLLTLQVQQIHQLQLIDRIRHQVLLFASHQEQIPKSPLTTDVDEHVSKTQLTGIGRSGHSRLRFLSQTKTPALMLSNNRFAHVSEDSHSPPPSSNSDHTAQIPIPNICKVVEDRNALVARQRKCKNPKLSAHTQPPKEALFKHKCRVCTKGFGSNSALQIYLPSHAGKSPYRCNTCGDQFPTRGNLKGLDEYHHIPMNSYLFPQNLGNMQTFDVCLSSERAAARWLNHSPVRTKMTSASLEESASAGLSCFIKKEEDFVPVPVSFAQSGLSAASLDLRSKSTPTPTSDSAETRQRGAMKAQTEDVKPSFDSKMKTMKSEESLSVIPKLFTFPNTKSFAGSLSFKHSNNPKVQLTSVTTDQRVSNQMRCVICQSGFSCQGELTAHFRQLTEEYPYQCELCSRAFVCTRNQKTHRAAAVPHHVQHSCPICHRKFTNSVVLRRHVHMHVDGHSATTELTNRTYSLGCNGEFGERNDLNPSDHHNWGFCDKQLPELKSVSIHLSPCPVGKHEVDANRKRRNFELHQELQVKWIKTERSNEDHTQTNNHQASAGGQQRGSLLTSDSLASKDSSSPNSQASLCLKTLRFDEPQQTWPSSSLTLHPSAAGSPNFHQHLQEKSFLKNAYCDICGKNFACQSALDIHYRSHTKEKPFVCLTCCRAFSTKGNLKQHMLTHQMRDFPPHLFQQASSAPASTLEGSMLKTDRKAFLNSCFQNGGDLSAQSRSSSVPESPACGVAAPRRLPKQHLCKTCGKSFSSSSALQIHERTHTGERPFVCTVCGRAFSTKGNLKVGFPYFFFSRSLH